MFPPRGEGVERYKTYIDVPLEGEGVERHDTYIDVPPEGGGDNGGDGGELGATHPAEVGDQHVVRYTTLNKILMKQKQ